ncbi:M20 family metallopeptidase [Peptoniphilus equinus]|uniref:M20 family metallopeptidase n=1 Tax=Peptoniphilus equinus TaxID=3016343 RepID=A0ABY7QTU9_9FIRM|nr:M20 family metallopeptidase [Peptoniphilus equinus]WBW49886.1 M20 family metallopeptidase [Peptoniphilus equinus]
MTLDELKHDIQRMEAELIAIRRHLHANPEPGMEEVETSKYIVEQLQGYNMDAVTPTGEVGVIAAVNPGKGKCIAIRADIDALRVEEATGVAWASQRPGVMHACGHDIHITCLLGAAKVIAAHKEDFDCTVKFIFQPAEERGQGAKYMISHGALDNPKPDYIIGLHCWPGMPAGTIYHRSGMMSAASDRFVLKVKGKPGHAAHPELAVDPIYIASQIVVNTQSIISRELSALESAVLSFTSIHGGRGGNVIGDAVELKGSIRSLSAEGRELIHRRLREIAEGIAAAHGGNCEVALTSGTPMLSNDPFVSEVIKRAAKEVFGEAAYIENPHETMGSEDFAYYLESVPGAMFRLGCGFKDKDNPPLHSNRMNPDEDCIRVGVLMHSMTVYYLSKSY